MFYNWSFFSLKIIGYTSIVGGILLYFSDLKFFQVINITNKNLIFVAGLFQCLASYPALVDQEVVLLLLE